MGTALGVLICLSKHIGARPSRGAREQGFLKLQQINVVTGAKAGVVELVDTPDLGSGGLCRGGSSPSARTNINSARKALNDARAQGLFRVGTYAGNRKTIRWFET